MRRALIAVAAILAAVALWPCDLIGECRSSATLEPLYGDYLVVAIRIDDSVPGRVAILGKTDLSGGKWELMSLPDHGRALVVLYDNSSKSLVDVQALTLGAGERDAGVRFVKSGQRWEAVSPEIQVQLAGLSLQDCERSVSRLLDASASQAQAIATPAQGPQYTFVVNDCRCSVMAGGNIAWVEIDYIADIPGRYQVKLIGGGYTGALSLGSRDDDVPSPGPVRTRLGVTPYGQVGATSVGNTFFVHITNPSGYYSTILCHR